MSEAEHSDSLAKLKPLFEKAKAGLIQFEGRHPEAKTIERAGYSYIVELRPKAGAPTIFGRTSRLVRLYYAEPLNTGETLLALHLATKPNGPDVHGEQDNSILVAGSRADDWSLVYRQVEETAQERGQ